MNLPATWRRIELALIFWLSAMAGTWLALYRRRWPEAAAGCRDRPALSQTTDELPAPLQFYKDARSRRT